jgi:GNAT superfamily N-acetyltransferase
LACTTEDWRRWLAPGVTFNLESAGAPRGLVARSRDPHDFSVVHLMAMWVHLDLRSTGVADLLVLSVKAWAAGVVAKQVRLKVVESNRRAETILRTRWFSGYRL